MMTVIVDPEKTVGGKRAAERFMRELFFLETTIAKTLMVKRQEDSDHERGPKAHNHRGLEGAQGD